MEIKFTKKDMIDFGKICSSKSYLQPHYLFEKQYCLPKTEANGIPSILNNKTILTDELIIEFAIWLKREYDIVDVDGAFLGNGILRKKRTRKTFKAQELLSDFKANQL